MHPIQARLTPHISALTELTIVLDLDIHGQQNFCHGKDALNDYPVDQDWVHIMSWAHMAGQATRCVLLQDLAGGMAFMIMALTIHILEALPLLFTMPVQATVHGFNLALSDSPCLLGCILCVRFVDTMLKLFGYAFAENDADFCYYYGRSLSLNLYVHILTSNDSIADDTCLGIPKCC
jgi:hypothetical protein